MMASLNLAAVRPLQSSVTRLHCPAYQDFVRDYLNGDKPVVITGALPPGLWHTSKMLSPSISLATNRANAANWSSFTRDAVVRVLWYLKPPTAAYMFAMGKFRLALGR